MTNTTTNKHYMSEYANLSQFDSIEAMDETIAIAKSYHAEELSYTQMEVLDFIAQHAVKVVGVAKLLVQTIADAVGKSLRTINYATKKLEDLGILYKVETRRKKSGGLGANVYVVSNTIAGSVAGSVAECVPSEIPCESKDEQPKIESETLSKTPVKTLIKTLKDFEKNNNTNLVKDIDLVEMQLFADTPQCLRTAYAGLENDLGNKLTKDIVLAFKKSGLSQKTEWTLQELCTQDDLFATELSTRIRDCVIKHRNGDIHTTLGGYIYTTALEMFKDRLTMIEAPTVDHNEKLDLFNNEFASILKNAKIERPTFVMPNVYGNVHTVSNDFNNDDLPY
ncbi:helix-turn-helix domain-containing protein [Bacillus thuringiensis]|uniref:helix-turn-helix domain-containing protein n=1 Tax=Bacillus thuringiensis TaxID=1428 RepID=UPI000BF311B7|nr:helix-turn-helix domain-containing protein [Bacillus thuringiensis]PEV88415.1 helix-turn-helix domain-containing protein [Bacillus thuringiensis]PFK91029.1 helix-turn-helix domain-containing protein [Bacillus thuringiensis]